MDIIGYILLGAFIGQIALLFIQGATSQHRYNNYIYSIAFMQELLDKEKAEHKKRIQSWWNIAREIVQLEREMKWMRQANEELEAEKNKLFVELDIFKAREVRKLGPKKSTTAIDPDGKIQRIRE